MKITFINEMADFCERAGADVQEVAQGIGLDERIGREFLHAGPGYGGSCFPKDTQALVRTARDLGAPLHLVETTIAVNAARKQSMAARIIKACDASVADKTIAILGLTFKPNTDDMRDSVSLDIIPVLQEAGAVVRVYDPEGMQEAKKLLSHVVWCADSYDAMTGADAVVILTEWNQFRALDWDKARVLLRTPRILDFRNIYNPTTMKAEGFDYVGIGRSAPASEA